MDRAKIEERLLSPNLPADPYGVYRELREESPVYWSEGLEQWLVTRYDDASLVLRDPKRYSSAGWEQAFVAQLPTDVRERVPTLVRHSGTPSLLTSDPPEHSRVRRLLNRMFTPRAAEALRQKVVEICRELLDAKAEKGRMDVVDDFAYPLPTIVVAEIFGAPRADRGLFQVWSRDVLKFYGRPQPREDEAERAERSLRSFHDYLQGLVDERRRNPRDDAIGILVATGESGDSLTDDEIIANCVLFLMAGHITTTSLIANGVVALIRHPDQLEALRREPERVGGAVEEILRWDGPVQRVKRVATEDCELRGARIRREQTVIAVTGAANRDPEVFPDPDRFDLARPNASAHVGFGYGVHFCIGAGLARLEGAVALPALLERCASLSLPDGWTPSWTTGALTRVLDALPVEFEPAGQAV